MMTPITRTRSRIALVVLVLVMGAASTAWAQGSTGSGSGAKGTSFVVESAMLEGLGAGALYPFVDTTPRVVEKAHIAITDSTGECAAGASAPDNLVILAGEAGVALESVMTAGTNTGIGSADQCVFHITIRPGKNGLPDPITDIVVVNGGSAALTGYQTVTVSATVSR